MLYLDTSLIVAARSNEPATKRVQAWLTQSDVERLLTSEWTVTETSSAFAIKLRTGQFDLRERAAALSVFNTLLDESINVVSVTSSHFRVAARFVDQHKLNLRAGDALHLAVASELGATVCTLDQRLSAAGPVLGVPTQLLS